METFWSILTLSRFWAVTRELELGMVKTCKEASTDKLNSHQPRPTATKASRKATALEMGNKDQLAKTEEMCLTASTLMRICQLLTKAPIVV